MPHRDTTTGPQPAPSAPRDLAWLWPVSAGLIAGAVAVAALVGTRPAAPPVPPPVGPPVVVEGADAAKSLNDLLYPVASTRPATAAELARLGTVPPRVPATGPILMAFSPPPPEFAAGAGPGLRAILARPMEHFVVKDMPADAALRRWAEQSGANLSVNWPPLVAYGITPALPVSLDLRGVPAGQVLELLVDRLGLPAGRAATVFADGEVLSIEIYGQVQSVGRQRLVTRCYNLRRLMLDAARWDAAVAGVAPSLEREEATSAFFKELLTGSVAHDSWEDNGGTAGTMHYWSGWLIVRNTPEVQEEVAVWLDALSRGGGPAAQKVKPATRPVG